MKPAFFIPDRHKWRDYNISDLNSISNDQYDNVIGESLPITPERTNQLMDTALTGFLNLFGIYPIIIGGMNPTTRITFECTPGNYFWKMESSRSAQDLDSPVG